MKKIYEKIRQSLWEKPWVVYAKKPFGSPKSVVEYLGRYTHKIAISNGRIRGIDDKTVTFDYKDYRQKGIKKQMVLSHEEFIRRFAMHILPKRFVKSVIMVFEQHLETQKLKNCNKIRHPAQRKTFAKAVSTEMQLL